MCEFGENYFDGGAESEPARGLLIFELRPFQGVKILSTRSKANVYKLTKRLALVDVVLNCVKGQIRSKTNTKKINLREADHFHLDKWQT